MTSFCCFLPPICQAQLEAKRTWMLVDVLHIAQHLRHLVGQMVWREIWGDERRLLAWGMEATDIGGFMRLLEDRILLGQVQTLRAAVHTVKSLTPPKSQLRMRRAWEEGSHWGQPRGRLQRYLAGWAVQTHREAPSSAKGTELRVQEAYWQLHKDGDL